MRAGDIAARFPTVGVDTPAADTARLLAEHDLPGLVVTDGADRLRAVLPGPAVLRMTLPPGGPPVAVTDGDRLCGAITLDAVLDRVLAS